MTVLRCVVVFVTAALLVSHQALGLAANGDASETSFSDVVSYQNARRPPNSVIKVVSARLLSYDMNLTNGQLYFPYVLIKFDDEWGPESVYLTEDAKLNGKLFNSCGKPGEGLNTKPPWRICEKLPVEIQSLLPARVQMNVWRETIWGRDVWATDFLTLTSQKVR